MGTRAVPFINRRRDIEQVENVIKSQFMAFLLSVCYDGE